MTLSKLFSSLTCQPFAGRSRLVALIFSAALCAVSCSDPVAAGTDGSGTASKKDAAGDTSVLGDGQICVPGTTDGCYSASQVRRCAPDGTGWSFELCVDDFGNATQCKEPGVCAVCEPGTQRCNPNNSLAVQTCEDNGTWSDSKTCDAATGQICVGGGVCQKACDFNAKAKSYAGCSFWAADLDNAFVPGGGQSYFDAANAQYAIVVANTSDKLMSTIEVQNNLGKQTLDSQNNELDYSPLQPGDLRVFNLPPQNVNGTVQAPLPWRVISTAPVAAYQFNPLENVNVYSNDASLLLPDEVLGKYYIVMSREQSFNVLRGFVTVIATRSGKTKVTITFSDTTMETLDGKISKLDTTVNPPKVVETVIKSYKSGEAASFELDQWDLLNIETNKVGSDITGTVVQATQPVAVFAGSEAANAPNTNHCDIGSCSADQLAKGDTCGMCAWDGKTPCHDNGQCQQFITCCADHLEMEMFPVKNWGSHYVAVKLKNRGKESDNWRIIAGTDGTKVALVPPQKDPWTGTSISIPPLNAGQWYDFEAGKGEDGGNFEIVAKHQDGSPAPVMVGHFMQSQDAPGPGAQAADAGTGDPAFLLAIPIEQWRQDYVFLTPNKYAENYMSVAAPVHKSCSLTSAKKGAECATDEECADPGLPAVAGSCADDVVVWFDGEPIAPDLWKPINKNFKLSRLFVQPGVHKVKALAVKDNNGVPQPRAVAVDVYGYDQYVSYGYPAGLDLKDLTLFKEPGE